MSGLVRALLRAMLGYVVGAVVTYGLVMALSANRHDKDVEAATTAAFVGGPLGAVMALVLGRRRRTGPPT